MSENRMPEEKRILRGLSKEEVEERFIEGFVNKTDISTEKSAKEIVKSNVFTYFNFIFLVITILLCVVGSFRNLTFLPIIIGNTLIGIIQELRAKKVLDKMSLLNAPHAIVIRDGEQKKILSERLVKDDVILLTAGTQICADAVVLEGTIQVNESLLTGEADEIEKTPGSKLMSGSFVVSGECYARLERVGKHSYISKLTAEAKAMGNEEQSEMIRSINQLVKWIGIVIIPIGIILFWQGYIVNGETFQKSIVSMVAAIIGMIPEGLYLLTTIALALGTMRLAKRQVLLHDMKSIEALARVDVLCVDKTGTITEAGMEVAQIVPAKDAENVFLQSLLRDYASAVPDNNATMEAIRDYLKRKDKDKDRDSDIARNGDIARDSDNDKTAEVQTFVTAPRKALEVMPFTSATKYSGVVFEDGKYLLGAPEFVMGNAFEEIADEIREYTKKGYRVLLLAKYPGSDIRGTLTEKPEPLGYVILSNPIRENAKKTFGYFKTQGVAVKVISGDNPETVSEVARCAGIEHAEKYVDAGTLDTDEKIYDAADRYTVFGRVTPKQKQKLVHALQDAGHTVAMTGDGVNDILAMKDADCSVAMASGSEAAAQAAQVVLLDSDFAHMPDVVSEGRQVVNNVQRSASLFLVKNIFSLLMAIFAVVVCTFKSFFVSMLLVLVIQCAVYIVMAYLSLTGSSIYFIALIIVQSILMGATIDYAILFTSYYVENRSYFKMNIRDALISTYNRSINAILTSASILIIVTAIVGNLATAIAAAVCQAISLGTFCATLIILVLLPALLATLDRFVVKKPRERVADAEKGIKKLLKSFKSLL